MTAMCGFRWDTPRGSRMACPFNGCPTHHHQVTSSFDGLLVLVRVETFAGYSAGPTQALVALEKAA